MKTIVIILIGAACSFGQQINGGGAGGEGGGGVTSIATTSPITGGTITTTGTIACATCTTNASPLTSNAVVIGGGGQAASAISADTATTHALFATAGAPAFRALAAGDIPTSAVPAITFPAPGTSTTLSGTSEVFVCTGTCTVTVPVPAAGVQYCAMNDDNVATVITLSAIGSSARYENQARTAYGTAGTGTFVSSGAVGDMVCILGRDSTHYLTASSNGTWTAN